MYLQQRNCLKPRCLNHTEVIRTTAKWYIPWVHLKWENQLFSSAFFNIPFFAVVVLVFFFLLLYHFHHLYHHRVALFSLSDTPDTVMHCCHPPQFVLVVLLTANEYKFRPYIVAQWIAFSYFNQNKASGLYCVWMSGSQLKESEQWNTSIQNRRRTTKIKNTWEILSPKTCEWNHFMGILYLNTNAQLIHS